MYLIIKKDGFYLNNQKLKEDVIYHLKEPCAIENDVTLKDVMLNTKNCQALSSIVSLFSHCNINEFNNFKQTQLTEDTKDYILRVIPYIDVFQKNMTIEFVFDAFHKTTKQLIGFDATPVEDYADLPITIQNNAVFSNEDDNTNQEFILDVTLIDFLSAIYFELSFYGSNPKQVKEFFDKAAKVVQRIHNEQS